MMRSVFFVFPLVLGFSQVSLAAGSLVLNPYPLSDGSAQGAQIQSAPVESSIGSFSERAALPFNVPQPGDSYFDPPTSASASQQQDYGETSPPSADAKAVTAELPSHYGAGNSPCGVDEAAVKKTPEETQAAAAQPIAAIEPAGEEITVQMSSDPFEDMRTEVVTEVQDATPPQAELAPPEPKSPAQPPSSAVADAPQGAQQSFQVASRVEPEEILWSGPRTEVKPMQKGPIWQALAGANISQVLGNWSRQADIELIWQTQNAFAVLESFETTGAFEGAVQDLLDQYRNNQVRPVATLHVDPETGRKTLVVRDLHEG